MGAFGDKFRKAREKKDISLDDVSNVTKISARMLQAIEQERFDQLPGGVFNKGFIRAYAKHLGLNDEEAVTDYLACLRQAQIDAHEVWQPEPPPPTPRPAAPEKSRGTTLTRPDLKKAALKKPELSKPALHKPAEKPQSPAPIEELPELQLPRAQDIRPRRKNFGDSSHSTNSLENRCPHRSRDRPRHHPLDPPLPRHQHRSRQYSHKNHAAGARICSYKNVSAHQSAARYKRPARHGARQHSERASAKFTATTRRVPRTKSSHNRSFNSAARRQYRKCRHRDS